MLRIPAVIQFSNKKSTYTDICGKPVIEFLTERLKKAGVSPIVAAITNLPEDASLDLRLKQLGLTVYRGDKDIPDCLLNAARFLGIESFVRINENNPLIDTDMMQLLYAEHLHGGFDYSFNGHEYGVLWGMDCDVISVNCLKKLISEELTVQQKNFFSYHIRQNSDKFHINKLSTGKKRSAYKLCLETEKDLVLLENITQNVKNITTENVNEYCDKHRALSEINREHPEKEIGIDKLFLHNEKLAQFLTLDKETVDSSYPICIELSLTNACNLVCVYCSDIGLRQRQGTGSTINLNVLRRLFADLKEGGTKGIVIEGGGEPCLHPEFNGVVRLAKHYGLAVGLITNGTVHLNDDITEEFEWIRVSLDASTRQEYLRLKKVDYFEKVLANISSYAERCGSVGVGYVVTNNNIEELESLILQLRESGATYIQLRPVVDNKELYPKNITLDYFTYYATAKFGVIIDGMYENDSEGNHGMGCDCHSLTSVICADGSVYLCGRLNIYDWLKPIGNINTNTFQDIWLGDKRQEQALVVKNEKFCIKNCPRCRMSKFNKRVKELVSIKSKNFI